MSFIFFALEGLVNQYFIEYYSDNKSPLSVFWINANSLVCRYNFVAADNYCKKSPCQNGGNCTNLHNAFNCNCPRNYSGLTCSSEYKCTHVHYFTFTINLVSILLNIVYEIHLRYMVKLNKGNTLYVCLARCIYIVNYNNSSYLHRSGGTWTTVCWLSEYKVDILLPSTPESEWVIYAIH